jgi:hypothetical protein
MHRCTFWAAVAARRICRRTSGTARTGNHRFWLLSALHVITKAPYKTDSLWEMRRAPTRRERARTVYGPVAFAMHAPVALQPKRAGGVPRVRLHCRFRNRGTEYVSKSGMKWMGGSTKRQCDRALGVPAQRAPQNAAASAVLHGTSSFWCGSVHSAQASRQGIFHLSEKGVRLAQKTQVGSCIPVGIQL